jgi:hypothetical protein
MAKAPPTWLQSPEGWGALNNSGATEAEAASDTRALLAEYELAKLFFDVFSGGRGPELLRHLEEVLFFTPIYATNAIAFNDLQIPLTPEQWCWVRVGQNSVLHHIRAMLVKAVDGPPGIETTERTDGQQSED